MTNSCKHRDTITLPYHNNRSGDSHSFNSGELEKCKFCGKIIKDSYQTYKGVCVSNGTARTFLPYKK